MQKVLKIAVADDHQIVIDGIVTMVQDDDRIKFVGSAHNGKEAIFLLQKKKVDVLLLDINMPGMDGMEALKEIRKTDKKTKIIALSMIGEMGIIQQMMNDGANGYVLKNEGKDALIKAIFSVYNGEHYFSEEIRDLANNKIQKDNSIIKFPLITRREKQILKCIVDEMTSSEIAEKLFISFNTVETHRKSLLLKLGVRNSVGLVKKAILMGLLEEN